MPKSPPLEETVCGLREPFTFWLWSRAAGKPDSSRVAYLKNVDDISFQTIDDRTLRGYRLRPPGTGSTTQAKAYLLVAQGNAILADQILSSFGNFAAAGVDVYIYDYRGYGRSEGKRRLKAMVNDYREIIARLDSQDYETSLLYGFSFGGIVLLNAIRDSQSQAAIVIDSTPSRLSDFGCPPSHDPVDALPENTGNFLFITGAQDQVISPAMTEEITTEAKARGAAIFTDNEFAHPFMEISPGAHNRRMKTIKSFLLEGVTPESGR